MSKKSKGDKPAALSKKERKALEAREAELAAELAAREAADRKADKRDKKSAKKAVEASEKSNAKAAKKKAKGKSSAPEPVRDEEDLSPVFVEALEEAGELDEPVRDATLIEAATGREVPTPKGMTLSQALSLKNDDGRPVYFDRMMRDFTPLLEDSDDETISGLTAHRHAATEETIIPIIDHTPDEIRVAAHKVLDDPNSSPGAREKATAALETADIKERVQAKAAERAKRAAEGTEFEHQQAHLKKGKKATPPLAARELKDITEEIAEADALIEAGAEIAEVEGVKVEAPQVAEVVETEQGRVFETGTPAPERAFVNPSDAGPELEEGRNGYKIIQLGTDGKPDPRKVRQMTRMTTYVNNIDDETTLKKWDKRMVIEGLAADATAPESLGLVSQINDLVHRRDVKIAKAIKADRKGKLGIGELGHVMKAAEKEARDALDDIVEQAAHLAGRNDKANLGTHLHTLAEIRDEHGIDRVRELQETGELVAHDNDGKDGLEPMPVTATDLATIEAYDQRMTRLGAKVIHSEAVIVDDEALRAGRLDRVIMARLPELVLGKGTPSEWTRPADQRARRYIMDLKSGNVELGAGKIARQLAGYALGKLYDLETGERTTHGAARDVALVFHLPQGEGVCTVHAVDLKAGTALLKLSAEVRRARNTGRKTIDTAVDIADPATDENGE